MNTLFRSNPIQIREKDEANNSFKALVLTYDVDDTYGTQFRAGCFDDSLANKLPVLAWQHDRHTIIGRATGFENTPEGLVLDFKMANVDKVDAAREAYSLLEDGILDGFSVGFRPSEVHDPHGRPAPSGRMVKGDSLVRGELLEVSIVTDPSVPGTRTLSIRADESTVDKGFVADLLVRFNAGDVDLADALLAVKGEAHTAEPSNERSTVERAGSEATLKEYWAHGEGAAKIRWGTPGDHTRCVKQLDKYLSPAEVHGFCTNVQKLAIGHAGNPSAAEKGRSAEDYLDVALNDLTNMSMDDLPDNLRASVALIASLREPVEEVRSEPDEAVAAALAKLTERKTR